MPFPNAVSAVHIRLYIHRLSTDSSLLKPLTLVLYYISMLASSLNVDAQDLPS